MLFCVLPTGEWKGQFERYDAIKNIGPLAKNTVFEFVSIGKINNKKIGIKVFRYESTYFPNYEVQYLLCD